MFQNNRTLEKEKVVERSIIPKDVIVGRYEDNPKLNSIVYDVDFSDSQEKEHADNEMLERVLTKVDLEGFSLMLMHSISG